MLTHGRHPSLCDVIPPPVQMQMQAAIPTSIEALARQHQNAGIGRQHVRFPAHHRYRVQKQHPLNCDNVMRNIENGGEWTRTAW